ncbi:methylamine utilization protein [Allohahella marinimesophila]|uniref:Methylamine utilization protein n=1 Tax=Allohahella marinimesophila TaxID=1054972 RepID=A0ABP7PVI6_9GAMM
MSSSIAAAELELRVLDLKGRAIPSVAAILYDAPPPVSSSGERSAGNDRIEIDQVDERFTPSTSIVAQDSRVWFPNSDNVRHHVYSFSRAKPFELTLYHANDAPPVVFDKTGVVLLGCNIHDSMRAAVVVTDQAVYGVTDEAGQLSLQHGATAAAQLTIGLWHEQLGSEEPLKFELDLSGSGDDPLTLTLPINWKPSAPESISDLKSRLQGFRKGSPQQ